MLWIFFASIFGFIAAAIASSKGHPAGRWFIYGFLLAIVAIPHALLLRPTNEAEQKTALAEGKKKCPHCAEMIQPDAKVCRFCGRDV